MSAERNNRITRAQPGDHSALAAHSSKLDGPEVYGRSGAVQDPDAGLSAVIEHGCQRHLDFSLGGLARQPNGYRRPKRCCRSFTVEHVTGLIGTGLSIGGVRQLPEMRRIAASIAPIHDSL